MKSETQRVYHFVNLCHGLDDLRRRRLKIAELMKINDPFEFLGANLRQPALRRKFIKLKKHMARRRGIICFSRDWSNPVQWSHYAESHTGICLGFDIPTANLGDVYYSKNRMDIDPSIFNDLEAIDSETAQRIISTKFEHWRYENEVRSFTTLEERDPETGFYFAEFGETMKLAEVIVGASCLMSEAEMMDALGNLRESVDVLRARIAFGEFRVVRQNATRRQWASQRSRDRERRARRAVHLC